MSASQPASFVRPTFKAESAEDLRELITQAELIVANLRGSGPRGQTLLFLLDTIVDLQKRLDALGVDLRAEETRIETVQRLLLAKDGTLVREMRAVGGLAAARAAIKPPADNWWWFLDARVADRQRNQLRRGLTILAGIVGVFLIVSLLYHYVFPPDPKQVAVMELQSKADQAIQAGDLAAATQDYRDAARVAPNDPELQATIGALEEKQGHQQEADAAYAEAEKLSPDHAHFLVTRGMSRVNLGLLDGAIADGKAAVQENPNFAEAYFLLGNAYEAQGDRLTAINMFSEAADKAGNSNPALVVLAKTRMGMLMQQAPMAQDTPAPTPTAQ